MENLLTTRQLACFLGVHEETIRTWAVQRKIPHYKVGKCLRFDQHEIKDWLKDRYREVAPSSKRSNRIKGEIHRLHDKRPRPPMLTRKIVRN